MYTLHNQGWELSDFMLAYLSAFYHSQIIVLGTTTQLSYNIHIHIFEMLLRASYRTKTPD